MALLRSLFQKSGQVAAALCSPASRTGVIARALSSADGGAPDVPVERVLCHEVDEGLFEMTLNRPPVNGFSMDFLQEICQQLQQLHARPAARGLIISSNVSNVFSAGLDIQAELHQPDPARLRLFWHAFQELFLELYPSRLYTMAKVEGHAPAGGCALMLMTDWRAMLDQPDIKVGLNETQLGIVAPAWLAHLYVHAVGTRAADRDLPLGTLHAPEAAHALGMLDATCDSHEELQARLLLRAKTALAVPDGARVTAKRFLRGPLVDALRRDRQSCTDAFCELILRDETQLVIGNYLKMLKSKSKKRVPEAPPAPSE